jgi:hypothetical protein
MGDCSKSGASFGFLLAALTVATLGRSADSASALEDRTGPVTVVEEPAYVAPLTFGIPLIGRNEGDRVAIGHWFTLAYENNCGHEKTLNSVKLVELPKTKARPFKAAVIYVLANYPAKKREYGPDGTQYETVCTADYRLGLWKVHTKRPAKKLIFFDGSVEPPHRVWPPVGTPPEK